MVTMDDFRKELHAQIERALNQGRPHIEVNAGELHRVVSPSENRMPMACNAMRQAKELYPHNEEIHAPPSGDGPSLTVRYVFSR